MVKRSKLATALKKYVKNEQLLSNLPQRAPNESCKKRLDSSLSSLDKLLKFQFMSPLDNQKVCSDSQIPFSPYSRVILLGEGNFSFSVALLNKLSSYEDIGNEGKNPIRVISTCYEKDRIALLEKYPEAENKLQVLETNPSSTVVYGVDATCVKTITLLFKKYSPSRIVFNFPHLGLSIKDQQRNISAHQKFITSIFDTILKASSFLPCSKNIHQMIKMKLSNGTPQNHILRDPELMEEFLILITIKEGIPYDHWNIKQLIRENTSNRISCCYSFKFDKTLYPGYSHVNTIGHYSIYLKAKYNSASPKRAKIGNQDNIFKKTDDQDRQSEKQCNHGNSPENIKCQDNTMEEAGNEPRYLDHLENKRAKTYVFHIQK